MSVLRHLAKYEEKAKEPVDGMREGISAFLMRELPPQRTGQSEYLTTALLAAAARYDRYQARAKECNNYSARRARLNRITKLAEDLALSLCELDILTHDDLANRIDENANEVLIGSLLRLSKETVELTKDGQKNGKARNVAEERWMLELADIYENAFSRPARVSGSGDGESKQHGSFYRMLQFCRPSSYPLHGKLSLRQVDRVLKQRKLIKRG
jgi:hypothetical protein